VASHSVILSLSAGIGRLQIRSKKDGTVVWEALVKPGKVKSREHRGGTRESQRVCVCVCVCVCVKERVCIITTC